MKEKHLSITSLLVSVVVAGGAIGGWFMSYGSLNTTVTNIETQLTRVVTTPELLLLAQRVDQMEEKIVSVKRVDSLQ